MYSSHSKGAVTAWFILANVGGILWLWSMYVYIPNNYPTRMRSLGTGWTDGMGGYLGAWGGVLIAGQLFSIVSPRSFFVFITIPSRFSPPSCSRSSAEPAPPRAGRTGPIDTEAAGLGSQPPLFAEVSPVAEGGSPAAQPRAQAGLPPQQP